MRDSRGYVCGPAWLWPLPRKVGRQASAEGRGDHEEGAVMDYQFWVTIGIWLVVCLVSHRNGKLAGKLEAVDTLDVLRVRDEGSTGYYSTTAHRLCERLRHWARTGEIDSGRTKSDG